MLIVIIYMETQESTTEKKALPQKFEKIITDFIGDIVTTFPEYEPIIKKWFIGGENKEQSVEYIFKYCQTVFPERFLDILYKNVDIFDKDSSINTEFLPGISFKYLWQCDISDGTRETIWKYLQLISVTIVGSIDNSAAFGDTAKIFETINENEFKEKLSETLEKMQSIFEQSENEDSCEDSCEDSSKEPKINLGQDIPSANDIHEHITGMMGGKLGALAREITEETFANLDIDMENVTDAKGVFQNLFKNPGKLMGLAKSVGAKLDSKLKSGELNESELISEATNLMSKMKDMPGMDNIAEMMGKMGMGKGGMGKGGNRGGAENEMPDMGDMAEMMQNMGGMQEMLAKMGLGKKTKLNTGAMEAQMEKQTKLKQMKERMKKNLELKQIAAAMQQATVMAPAAQQSLTDDQLVALFNTSEKAEKTPRTANPNSSEKKKKKKGKK